VDGSLIIWKLAHTFVLYGAPLVIDETGVGDWQKVDDLASERSIEGLYNEVLVLTAPLVAEGRRVSARVSDPSSVGDPESPVYLGGYRTRAIRLGAPYDAAHYAALSLWRWCRGRDLVRFSLRNGDLTVVPRTVVEVDLSQMEFAPGQRFGIVESRYRVDESTGLPRLVSEHVGAAEG
jgi:hypothetical protein